jgi:hemerythrin superfamily protein
MLVSEAIGQDHQYLDTCYNNFKSASTTSDKIKWRNMLVWNLARHAISEKLTVYPAMEKWLGEEGKALTKVDFEQHQAVCHPSSLS